MSIFDEINDTISHCRREGLPLTEIELSNEEWDELRDDKRVRELLLYDLNTLDMLSKGSANYRGVKLRREGDRS